MVGVLRWMGLFPECEHRIVRIIGGLCRGLRFCTVGIPALIGGLLRQYERRGLAYQTPGSEPYRVRSRCGNRASEVRVYAEDLNALYIDAEQQNGGPTVPRAYTYFLIHTRDQSIASYEGHLRQPTLGKY